MDLYPKKDEIDQAESAYEVVRDLEKITKIIPHENIDSNWIVGTYAANKNDRQFKNEFVYAINEFGSFNKQILILIAELDADKLEQKPRALVYFWNNHLWPLYTLTFFVTIPKNQLITFRAFLPIESRTFELFLRNSPLIIFIKNKRIISALELDISKANKSLWRHDPRKPHESIKDEVGAKSWVESHLTKNPTNQQKIEFSWAQRLDREAEKAIRFYRDPNLGDEFKKEREHLSKYKHEVFFKEDNPIELLFLAYQTIFWDNKLDGGELLHLINKISELDEIAYHQNLVRQIMICAWFSSRGTLRGRYIPSLGPEGNVTKLAIDLENLGDCINHFWERIPFGFPTSYKELVGSYNCPIDVLKFVSNSPVYQGEINDGEQFVKDLLSEAVELKEWTIPSGAYVQLELGIVKSAKFFEMGSEVACLLVDQTGHYLLIWVHPAKNIISFIADEHIQVSACSYYVMKYLSQEIENLKDHEVKTKQEEFATRLKLGISIVLAAIIRDFWVVEERHSIFGSGLRTRKFPRIKSDQREPKIFYLPRLRYIRDIKGKANDLNYQSRRPHFVSGHLRKALHASDKQIFLARKYGIIVPEGFTFVRPHKRGDQAQERIYRSRSALKCLQALKNGYSEGSGDLWFKYELNVKNWLNSNGYIVDHLGASKSGDGGVDIQASKEDEHLLVQCKYWQSQKIGPNIIREMIGTLNTFPEGSRGVIVTPSELTAGAKQLAIENGIQYIELADFGTRITCKL